MCRHMQCVAVCWSVLQCAVCCSALQCVAVCCSMVCLVPHLEVLPPATIHCSVTAAPFSHQLIFFAFRPDGQISSRAVWVASNIHECWYVYCMWYIWHPTHFRIDMEKPDNVNNHNHGPTASQAVEIRRAHTMQNFREVIHTCEYVYIFIFYTSIHIYIYKYILYVCIYIYMVAGYSILAYSLIPWKPSARWCIYVYTFSCIIHKYVIYIDIYMYVSSRAVEIWRPQTMTKHGVPPPNFEENLREVLRSSPVRWYGVVTVGRIDKITVLFCRMYSLL